MKKVSVIAILLVASLGIAGVCAGLGLTNGVRPESNRDEGSDYPLSETVWGIDSDGVDTQMISELNSFCDAIARRPMETGGTPEQNANLSLLLQTAADFLTIGNREDAVEILWNATSDYANPWLNQSFTYLGSSNTGLISEVTGIRRIPIMSIAIKLELPTEIESESTNLTEGELRRLPEPQSPYGILQRYGYVQAVRGLQIIQKQLVTYPHHVGGTANDRQTLDAMADDVIALILSADYQDAIDYTWNVLVPFGLSTLDIDYIDGTRDDHWGYSELLGRWIGGGFAFRGTIFKMVYVDLENPFAVVTTEFISACENCVWKGGECSW